MTSQAIIGHNQRVGGSDGQIYCSSSCQHWAVSTVNISKHFTTKQFSIKCRTQGIYQTWKWRRGKKWTYNVSLWWMTVNYFSAMPIYSEVWSAAVDGGGSKLWMLEDNEDNQREDCSRKRTNSLFSFLHLRHISCCCCWVGEQCNCIIVLPRDNIGIHI